MIVVTGSNDFIGSDLIASLARGRPEPLVSVDEYPSIAALAEGSSRAPEELRYRPQGGE